MGDLSLIAREPSNTATWHLYDAILGGAGQISVFWGQKLAQNLVFWTPEHEVH